MKNGFTLIELLVVVLIIGILAAIALPQYEAAVLKSRMATALPLMRAVKESAERYYLANGSYTDDWSKLDIQPPQGYEGNSTGGAIKYPNGAYIDLLSQGVGGVKDIVGGVMTDSGQCLIKMYLDQSNRRGESECGLTSYGGVSMHPKCAQICKSMGY